jgi:hypothetical protein
MKRKVLFVASLFLATATFAQDGLTSKKGEAYLPEAGDWSIGFDASALTSFVGNMANAGNNNAGLTAPMMDNVGQEIRFKMFKDEKTAYRLRARIGMSSSSTDVYDMYNPDALNTTADEEFTTNTKTSSGLNLVLGAGLEKRRGNTRIQGYYGGEVFFGLLGGTKTTTSTGSVLSDDFNLNTTDPLTNVVTYGERQTEDVQAGKFTLGLQGFIGVEWFFAPKVSLGAEYTWGLAMNSFSETSTTVEFWGRSAEQIAADLAADAAAATAGNPNPANTADALQSRTDKGQKNGDFSLDTGNHNAMINLNFHF